MNPKSIITGILLLFVAVSAVYLTINESGRQANVPQGIGDDSAGVSPDHLVIAYYFHGHVRCPT
ncbi:MAG: hypothetical protein KAW46_06935, partial [candidate division Zixibacteria bacterium]|nr:hypothetical protein [candidate division Zixibacteria bacterium]